MIFRAESRLKLDEERRFSVPIPLDSETTSFQLMTVDPYGKFEQTDFVVVFPGLQSWKDSNSVQAHDGGMLSRISYSTGIGYTSAVYKEPWMSPYQLSALTAKAAAVLPLGQGELTPWDVGASGYVTAFSLSSSSPEDVRFLGINCRAGYRLTETFLGWRPSVHGGLYYTTMQVRPARFGYQNVAGPQLFPTFRKPLSGGHSVLVYFKFSPVSANFSVINLSSREIAGGGAYLFGTGVLRKYSATLDFAHLQLKLGQASASSQSITVGVNRGF